MRSIIAFMVAAVLLGGTAQAQTKAAPPKKSAPPKKAAPPKKSAAATKPAGAATPDKAYVEGVVQSAFGNATSQSYGVEGGVTIGWGLQVFVEAGRINNVATPDLGPAAQRIADFLGGTTKVKEPASFWAAGIRYRLPVSIWEGTPYVMGGIGAAKMTKDVHFFLGGADVTNNLAPLGVVLGTDLSGDFRKPMVVIGGGLAWPAWQRLVIDLQYRYGRISAEDVPLHQIQPAGINVNRVGVGIGIRF